MTDTPNAIDVRVGATIRQLRRARGLTQERLATDIGVTFQQLQKYERGSNRVSASRLHAIAKVLEEPISAFFDEGCYEGDHHSLMSPQAVAMGKLFETLSPAQRRVIEQVVRSMSGAHEAAAAAEPS